MSLPFALVYLHDDGGPRLAAASGIAPEVEWPHDPGESVLVEDLPTYRGNGRHGRRSCSRSANSSASSSPG